MEWKLTTESPKESGHYVVAIKNKQGGYPHIGTPMLYSRKYDAWNATDDGDENRIPDLRDWEKLEWFESCIYAWAKVDDITPKELDALGKGVA